MKTKEQLFQEHYNSGDTSEESFLAGYDARDAEVERLKERTEKLEMALSWSSRVCERIFAGFEKGIDSIE